MKSPPRSQMARLHRRLQTDETSLVFARLADQFRLSEHVEDAMELLHKGLQFHPDYASGHIVLGNCYLDLGALEDAREAFLRALALDSENILILKKLGDILHRQGATQEALEHYRRALELEPNNADLREVMGKLTAEPREASTGEHVGEIPLAQGRSYFQEEVLEPEQSLSVLLKEAPSGQSTEEQPSLSPKEEELLQADVESDAGKGPPRGMATATLAEIYFQQGLLGKAIDTYQKVLRHKPEDQAIRERLKELRAMRSSRIRQRKASPEETAQDPGTADVQEEDPPPSDDIQEEE